MCAKRDNRGIFLLGASITFALLIAFSPSASHADSVVNVVQKQVIPPATSSSACAPIQVSDIHPFVYEGAIHSFDFVLSAPSYVALGGTIGETPIDFQYMTRWQGPNGLVRIHVDVAPMRLTRDVPINVVLISAAGQVTCTANVFTVIPKLISIPQYPTTPTGSGNQHPVPPISQPSTHPIVPPPPTSGSTGGPTATSETATTAPMFVGALHSLGNLCQVGGATRLWIVLVVLYGLFVLTLLLQKPDTFGERTLEWNIALILVLFLGLVGFWYLSLSCRTGPWAPALSTAIAIVGLICLLILGRPAARPVLLLEEKEEEKKEVKKEDKKDEKKK